MQLCVVYFLLLTVINTVWGLVWRVFVAVADVPHSVPLCNCATYYDIIMRTRRLLCCACLPRIAAELQQQTLLLPNSLSLCVILLVYIQACCTSRCLCLEQHR